MWIIFCQLKNGFVTHLPLVVQHCGRYCLSFWASCRCSGLGPCPSYQSDYCATHPRPQPDWWWRCEGIVEPLTTMCGWEVVGASRLDMTTILLMEEILHRRGHVWQYGMTSTPAPPVQCCVFKPCAPVQDFRHSTSRFFAFVTIIPYQC